MLSFGSVAAQVSDLAASSWFRCHCLILSSVVIDLLKFENSEEPLNGSKSTESCGLNSAGIVEALARDRNMVADAVLDKPGARSSVLSSTLNVLRGGDAMRSDAPASFELPFLMMSNMASPLGAVVKFSYPLDVISRSSSMRTPPTGRYRWRTLILMYCACSGRGR